MNQGKLDMVKQEMARLNIEILGISELKWTGRGQFNSDDHFVYYCGQESFRRNEVALTVNKSPKCSTWMQPQKRQNDLSSFPRQTIQPHCDPSLSPNHWCQRSWGWPVLWKLRKPSRTIGGWNAKVGSQEILGLPWCWMVCLGNELRSFCHFWDCTQAPHFRLLLTMRVTPFLLN